MGKMFTRQEPNGDWFIDGVKWSQLDDGMPITTKLRQKLYGMLFKLMQYERTGKNPDEIEMALIDPPIMVGKLIESYACYELKAELLDPAGAKVEINRAGGGSIQSGLYNLTVADWEILTAEDEDYIAKIRIWTKEEMN